MKVQLKVSGGVGRWRWREGGGGGEREAEVVEVWRSRLQPGSVCQNQRFWVESSFGGVTCADLSVGGPSIAASTRCWCFTSTDRVCGLSGQQRLKPFVSASF